MASSAVTDLPLLIPDWPAPARVRAVVTTREGGCGSDPYRSLNVAHHVGDRTTDVESNRALLGRHLATAREPCWLNQVHGTEVAVAEEGAGSSADASYTRTPDLPCVVMVADCMPILLSDGAGTQVAALHGGWKGLAAGVVEATIDRFEDPAPILAWLGPAIGPCHYEVGGEVKAAFGDGTPGFSPSNRPGHWMMDLYAVARSRLVAAGVTQVYGGGFCSYCDEARFFSYRRDGITGRNAALIWIAS